MLSNTASRLRRKIKLETKHLALLLPIGVFIVILATQKHEQPHPSTGKEKYYLRFNKEEIFKNLIATEEHFRNVEEAGIDTEGFLNCNVKHLGSCESHADEAISHALIAETEESSEKFRKLRNKIREFRRDLQSGKVTPTEGIKRTREVRHEFEAFNPRYDISTCEACEVHVEIKGLG